MVGGAPNLGRWHGQRGTLGWPCPQLLIVVAKPTLERMP